MIVRPEFHATRGTIIVRAVGDEAIRLAVDGFRAAWPPPDLASEQLEDALQAGEVDERTFLTIEQAQRAVEGFRSIGKPGIAGDLALCILKARGIREALSAEDSTRLTDALIEQAGLVRERICAAVDAIEDRACRTIDNVDWRMDGRR